MKRFFTFFLSITMLLLAANIFAQDGIFAGLETGAAVNTRNGMTFGIGINFGLDINEYFAAGLKAIYSHDMETVSALEASALFRYYLPLPLTGSKIFVQGDFGGAFFFEYGEMFPALMGGLTVGWHFPMGDLIYIEPSVRGGYPFGIGMAFGAGVKLDFEKLRKN